jgi:hypothetical protein
MKIIDSVLINLVSFFTSLLSLLALWCLHTHFFKGWYTTICPLSLLTDRRRLDRLFFHFFNWRLFVAAVLTTSAFASIGTRNSQLKAFAVALLARRFLTSAALAVDV